MKARIWLWVLGVCALIPACLAQVPSADLWWLLAQGQWICQYHQLPTLDTYSFTAAGHVWHNDQWLSALIFYGIDQAGGLLALHIFKAVLLCATFVILLDSGVFAEGLEENRPLVIALTPLVGLACLWTSQKEFFFDVRAYLFSYLLAALWWRWLLGRRPISAPALIITAWLWCNLHAGVLIGLGLLFAARIAGHPHLRTRVLLGATWVTLVNPSGWALHLHVVRLLGSQWGHWLNEWVPVWRDFSLFGAYLVYLTLSMVVLVYNFRRSREDRWEAFGLLALGGLSLTGWRHVILFCWLSIPLWCRVLASLPYPQRLSPPQEAREGEPQTGLAVLWPALLLALLTRAGWSLKGQTPDKLSMVNTLFPHWASDFLDANQLGPRLFNPYGCGGYLLWRLAPKYQVCIDGRAAQVYPVEAYVEYIGAAFKREKLLQYLDDHQIDTVLLSNGFREAGRELLEGDANWPTIYEDDLFTICQRKSTVLAQYQHPDNPRSLIEQARNHPEQGMELTERALALDPDYPQAYFMRGFLFLRQGQADKGVADTVHSLQLCPTLPNAHLNLAIYYKGKDPQRCRQEAQLELLNDPRNAQARQLLQDLGAGPTTP